MNICFIGFGNMAKAIAHGLLNNPAHNLMATAPSLPVGVNAQGIQTHFDNKAFLHLADVVMIAVKPLKVAEVLAEIQLSMQKTSVIISLAASVSLGWLGEHFPGLSMIRAMPNIAASVHLAATPLFANSFVSDVQKLQAETIFKQIGIFTWVDEDETVDALTALSGSGPAYVFLWMESMVQGGLSLGLSEDVAKNFTFATLKGALEIATKEPLSLVELRKRVTSPGGTTEAAMKVFEARGFSDIMVEAMQSAFKRASQLEGQKK